MRKRLMGGPPWLPSVGGAPASAAFHEPSALWASDRQDTGRLRHRIGWTGGPPRGGLEPFLLPWERDHARRPPEARLRNAMEAGRLDRGQAKRLRLGQGP